MNKTRDLIFIILLMLPVTLLAQNSYYVSSSEGNDSNSGISTGQAWKTLAKVNSFTPRPGDKILFKRGDEWEGTITVKASGTSGNPITYGAYGTGEKPKIYGSKTITGWTLHSGNIYKASFNENIEQLFVNEERMMLARYPNEGYSINNEDIDSNINFTGASYIERTSAYTVVSKVLQSSSVPISGNGFILTNKLELLDSAGEWYYDALNNTVYLWTENDNNPSNYQIRGSINNFCMSISSKSYITIQELSLLQCNNSGIIIDNNSDYVSILGNTIKYGEQYGIYLPSSGSNNTVISNNLIEGSNRTGIWILSPNSSIEDNTVINIGLQTNWHKIAQGQQVGTGIFSRSDNCTINHNRIVNTGYDGINFYGQKTMVKFNFVNNAMSTLGDGGAIYTYNGSNYSNPASAGSEIMYNLVINSTGNRDGYPKNNWDDGYGIYMDDRTHDVKIHYNTVHNCNAGIYLHIAGNIEVKNNSISNCNAMMLSCGEEQDSYVTNNTFYAYNEIDDFIWWQDDPQRFIKEDGASPVYDYNKYVNHYNSSNIFNNFGDWLTWKNNYRDASSTFKSLRLDTNENEKLFYNDTKQTKIFSLGSGTFKDIFGNVISNSFTLEPFTSKIVIGTNFDQVQSDNQAPIIQDQKFDLQGDISINQLIGQVNASDPDAGQSLSYSIIDGNTDNLFSIDRSSGVIKATANSVLTSDLSYNLVVQVTDDAVNPLSSTANIQINIKSSSQVPSESIDTTSPTITGFSIPSTSTSLTIDIQSFTATDNVQINGYFLSENNVNPSSSDENWVSSQPAFYTFSSEGEKNLYAWVKDAAGNISVNKSAAVTISLPAISSDFSEYLFEEGSGSTVLDSKGSNDGSIINNVSRTIGIKGDGLELNGSSYINLGKSFGDNIQDEVTLSAWIQPTLASGGYQGIIMHGGPNFDSFALYIHTNNQTIGFKTSGTSSSWTSVVAPALFDGNWHHLTATYDGSQKIIYLDNTVLVKANSTGLIESGAGYNLLIGAGRDETPPTLIYTGLIDEVRIYNYALTSSEISELYFQVQNSEATGQTDKESTTATNQAPTISDQYFEISQPKITNEFVGKVVASDPDASQQISYSITSGNNEGLFMIDPVSGDLYTNSTIETNTNKSVVLYVTVSDNETTPLSSSAQVTVSINTMEVNLAPVVSDQTFEIRKNNKSNDLVGQVIASDPNIGQTLTYSIVSGNTDNQFYMDPNTGEIFTDKALLLTSNQTIILAVDVKDNGLSPLSSRANITVNVIADSKLVNAEVKGNNKKQITLYYTEPLQETTLKSTELISAFTVNNSKSIKKVSIKGNEIRLDVDSDFNFEDEIYISYDSSTSAILDLSGNEIDSFTNYIVENNLPIETDDVTTDVETDIDNGTMEVSFYPNPSNGFFTIRANNLIADNCIINMYNMQGSLVANKEIFAMFGSLEERIDMTHLSTGTYIIHFINESQTKQNKLIIQ
ncbi:cadherin domain-containing protein [Sunxiuqinia sp. A32]|uniref:cadherin domain-containing protein n=1 Tax=Sunxiuqinia sp. A32 TaxID=3461496 RepID=UPI0040456C39